MTGKDICNKALSMLDEPDFVTEFAADRIKILGFTREDLLANRLKLNMDDIDVEAL